MDIRGFLKHNDFTATLYFEANEKGNFIKTENREIHHISEIPVKSEGQKEGNPILFTSADGYEIKEGDKYCKVNDYSDWSIVTGFVAEGAHDNYKGKKFKEESKALTYIAENKKVYSYADIKTEFDKSIVQLEQKAKDEFDGWKMSGIMDCKRLLDDIVNRFKSKL